jgi:hypothetical protein
LPLLLLLFLLLLLDTNRAYIAGLKDRPSWIVILRTDTQWFKATAVHGRVACDVENCFAN